MKILFAFNFYLQINRFHPNVMKKMKKEGRVWMANAGRREESKGGKGGYIPTSVLRNRKIRSVYINKIG